ncbi:M13 family metallopeptidase [Methanoregula formicica]|uniref:Putative metalloendopeptidase n=1 Tax=Methanoregula formicica (strain DSM 22288 / NBRC 105244 / SMSP) TaxID=593750 RepID=L0HIC6_METFS|nr:M13 family metallopeptidase [Methanoregula formicica]AGB03068.1 putative metalloendopeptidase [Methanoregula formicica SMSP]
MKRLLLIVSLIACLAAAGCTTPIGTGAGHPVSATPAPQPWYTLNESIRPGDDFYTHVNDAWQRENPIPADKKYVGTLTLLRDKADEDLHALMSRAANATVTTTDRNTALIGQFYRSGMDTQAIDAEGLETLSADLAAIDAIGSREDLANVTVVLLERGATPLYFYLGEVNTRNTTEVIATLWQGGLGMPDRDYYTRTDNKSVATQEAYQDHIRKVLVLSGESGAQAAADAKTIYAMEKTLALGQFTNEENRDPQRTTNVYTLAELKERWPSIGWDRLTSIPGSGQVTKVNVYQPKYLDTLEKEISTAPLADWKLYLRYRLIDETSPYLGASFEEEHFAFYDRTLNGVTEMLPRWKRVVHTGDSQLGDLVGKQYVAEYVDPRTHGMVTGMFQTIRQTFDARMGNLTWMGSATKERAREKLAAMRQKIAYPDTWMDYAGLELTGSYSGNVRAASAYNLIHGPYGLGRIGRPVDPDVWFMSPQTVNAYYNPSTNEIVFPAAILQPPFFDPDADAARNYGALGAVVAHEMTHGFDDQGRQYDKDGNLADWWTEEDRAQFTGRTALLVSEYNQFEVLPGLPLNGNLTLGENIADLGGVTIAYHAWRSAAGPASDPVNEREFFYAYAQVWRENAREEAERNWVYTDPHSASKYRVNGVVFNIPEFYETFPEIQPGDALYRNESERAVIW